MYFLASSHAHQLREVTADREDWTSNEIRRQTIYRPIEQGIQAEIDFYPQVSNSYTVAVIKGYKSILYNLNKDLIPLSYETTKRKPSSTSKQTKRRRLIPSEEEEESSVGGRKLIKRTKKRIHKHKTKRLRPVHRRRRNTNKHRIIKRK
jgi:hypothetical protein